MKVNFPLPLSGHHIAEELFIIQKAVVVFVIRINDILGGETNESMEMNAIIE